MFGTCAPELESVVVPLTAAASVGGGSGTPSAGNWLVAIVGMTETAATAGCTVGVADDIRSWWRPAKVSTAAALTRTAVWYTPNTVSAAGNVYVAPSGAFAAMTVLILEISGAGDWDTITAAAAGYAAAATSLNLALPAPAAASFTVAAAAGDSTVAGQAFAPSGWTALATVSAANGTDHTTDSELTSAFLPSNTGPLSVNATATSAEDLSGVIVSFQVNAPSPIPAGQNPEWPYLLFEAAFGAGFQTPPDELTWTDLSDRLWSWDETTGIQYQLGQVQASNVQLEVDNFDNALGSDNPSSPYAGQILTGVPLRIRAAIGTIGGVTVNRWYVIQRNMQEWPQEIGDDLRRYIAGTATDIWSSLSAPVPTPYRGEILQDVPYAWWPMDDQPGTAGVLPTSLLNAAPGNTNVLAITPAPGGISLTTQYFTDGTSTQNPWFHESNATSMAVYADGVDADWLPGDPQSSTGITASGGLVSAAAGAAAWQQSNMYGNTGAQGWFLTCNDTSFPSLSGGITVEGWFQYPFIGVPNGSYNTTLLGYPAQNAVCPYTLITLATATEPAAVLQIDTSGHLNLITYDNGTATSIPVYTATDLRMNAWFMVTMTLTATSYQVWVNGGATASVSGTAAIAPAAWTWLAVNGDWGTSGGGTPADLEHGASVSIAHVAVYPRVLPYWRVLAHYWAGVTGFGQLPAPTGMQIAISQLGAGSTPDGQYFKTSTLPTGIPAAEYGFGTSPVSMAAVVTAQAPGGITSAPSAWGAAAGPGTTSSYQSYYYFYVNWTGVAPSFAVYNGTEINSETQADLTVANSSLMTNNFGSSTVSEGIGSTGAGNGSAPPSAASAIGDTVAQRIERLLGYAKVTWAGRCIDPAPLLVQAAGDISGQAAADDITNIAQSDSGLLFVDNLGNLTYWQRPHLAAQYTTPAWTLGPAADGATVIPYQRPARWTADPQRIWNTIQITPYSPSGATLPIVTPANAAAVTASQQQYGAQPYDITSYLQSTAEMLSQANWLLTEYGQLRIRAEDVTVDAASYPAAWPLVLGVNVGDVVSMTNWQIGGGGTSGTFRVSRIRRNITYGAKGAQPEASVTLTLDWEPSSRWT